MTFGEAKQLLDGIRLSEEGCQFITWVVALMAFRKLGINQDNEWHFIDQ